MIQLRTLGRLDLRDDHGEPISSVLLHPKRLAFLAYLAAAQPRGHHRRDTLLALFWPELDAEHARAALRKAVHYLRRSLGDDVIVNSGDDEIGLDFTRIDCDACELQDAAGPAELKAALESYHGPFLDGFFLDGVSGFEDWVERQRQQLHSRAFRAAWSLAEAAERTGDAFGAAHWGRRAAALTPDDEGALRNLMALLDRLGDRAGALAAYEDFARRLRREYDVEPALETRALEHSVRTRGDDAVIHVAVAPSSLPQPEPVQQPEMPTVTAPLRRRTLTVAVAVIAVILVAGVSTVRKLPSRAAPAASAHVIAVLPFAYRGHPELAYLRDGMVNLLSTNLDQVGEFRAADPAAVLSATDGDQHLSPDQAGNVATRIGAGLFVSGDIVEAGGRLRVSAALHDARHPQRILAQAAAEGDAARLFELIDRVTSQLVASERRAPAERFTRLALLTTHSMPALKAYLTGEQQFRAGRYNEAVESFQRAVAADSTFALGYYRLALAHMWGSNDNDRAAAERAIKYGSRLAAPDRALLEALRPFFRGDADEAERQYRAILVLRPDESEVWYPLGEVLFHHNPARGRPAAEAKNAFQRALTLGPKDGPLTHLAEIAAIERDYVAFDSLFSGIQEKAHFYYVGDMVRAFVFGEEADRERVLLALRDSSDARLVTAGRHAVYLLERRADGERILSLLTDPTRPRDVRSWGHIHLAYLAAGGGRLANADTHLRKARSVDPGRALEHEAALLTLPFVNPSADKLRELRRELVALPAIPADTTVETDLVLRGDREAHAQVRLYLRGLIDAQLKNYPEALAAADALPGLAGTAHARALGSDLAHAVRAEVLRMQGRPADALAELQKARIQFDANRLNGPPFYAQVRERYVRGDLLVQLHRDDEALGWFASFDEHGPWGRALLAPAVLQQARIHDRLGHSAEAARNYARFVGLWQDAEPQLRPIVDQANQRLGILQPTN